MARTKPKTKTELKLLELVRGVNTRGGLAGLRAASEDRFTNDLEGRMARRLVEAGELVWMPYSDKFGSGWALREFVERFYHNGYKAKEGSA